jgi:hypothetical protein
MRFVYDNPRHVLGEYNPVEYIAQISPTLLLRPAGAVLVAAPG